VFSLAREKENKNRRKILRTIEGQTRFSVGYSPVVIKWPSRVKNPNFKDREKGKGALGGDHGGNGFTTFFLADR